MKLHFPALAVLSLATAATVAADGATGAKWGYKEQDDSVSPVVLSPENWGQGYPTCNGKRQSPIDIDAVKSCKVKEDAPLSFSGDCSSYGLQALEDTFKWTATNTTTCKVHKGDKTFSLLQFHMHMPSEHTVNGKNLAGEAHFVHQEDGGSNLLVIGMFIDKASTKLKGSENQHPWIDTVWNTLDDVDQTVEVNHSYADLLKDKMAEGNVFNYPGSLTTPPCSEIVDWWVIKSPLRVSSDSLASFKEKLATLEATDEGEGARPVQPLNGRVVTIY
ncbi:Carbonic anhydrase, partial [Globisporangium splendens]